MGPCWASWVKKDGGANSGPPLGGSQMASWGPLGPLLGVSWALLGPSWSPLGALLGLSWAILRPQRPIGSEKARRQKTLFVFLFFPERAGAQGSLLVL